MKSEVHDDEKFTHGRDRRQREDCAMGEMPSALEKMSFTKFHATMIDEFHTFQEITSREIDDDIADSLDSSMIADEMNVCVSRLNSLPKSSTLQPRSL